MLRVLLCLSGIVAALPANAQCSAYGGPCQQPQLYQMVPGPSGPMGQTYYVPGGNGPSMAVQQPQTHSYNGMPTDAATFARVCERRECLASSRVQPHAEPMPRKAPPKPDDKPQYERFLEAAREHATSEDPEVFEHVFRQVMKSRRSTIPPKPSSRDEPCKNGPLPGFRELFPESKIARHASSGFATRVSSDRW
jgi:hypothetical protein